MQTIQEKANQVASVAYSDTAIGPKVFESGNIVIIVQIIIQLIKLYRSCNVTPQEAVQRMKNPSFLDRARLRLLVVRQSGFFSDVDSSAIRTSLLKIAQSCTPEEVDKMYTEVDLDIAPNR